MAEKVFISYAHQDSNTAQGIARFLRRHGCDVWIDSDKISLGRNWSGDIETALAEAQVVVGILSANSIRRSEVLKEINFALERMKKEDLSSFRLFFVVIGQIHPSWFKDRESVRMILDYLTKYQYIQLSAYGEVTIEAMKKLLEAIRHNGIEQGHISFRNSVQEEDLFINQNSVPEKAFDNKGNNIYCRVFPADLTVSCVYPFALDNQWLPEEMYDPQTELYAEFEKDGFSSAKVQKYLRKYKQDNFYLPFFHTKQMIIKRNTLVYDPFFRDLILSEGPGKDAFVRLLSNGSIVVFLYGDNEFTPFIHGSVPARHEEIRSAWNRLCEETSVYCIRENWAAGVEQHKIDFLRFCSNLAIDRVNNRMLAESMHLSEQEEDNFLFTLKTISMQAFCQTHMNGTEKQGQVDAYSRSAFYRNYIVRKNDPMGRDPEISCLFDVNKPFHHQLKRLIDIYYNSMFTNYFQCAGQLPNDERPENFCLEHLYMSGGEKEVSIEELQYAFSEFFENYEILDDIGQLGEEIFLANWDLEKITQLRRKEEWLEYIELLEMIRSRANTWKVDFNEIELLVQRFVACFKEEEKTSSSFRPAYSFRICIGPRVLDIVRTNKVGKIKEYGVSFSQDTQIPLRIQFCIGDLTLDSRLELISLPVTLFDGRIDTSDGQTYFNRLKDFLMEQYDFITIS